MNLLSDPRWSEALAHLPDYLGNHVAGQRVRAGARPCDQPAACDCGNAIVEYQRGVLLGLASIVQTVPAAWRCWRCSIRCCWLWRHCRWRGSELASRRSDSSPRCWRSRSIPCCRCCATPSPALRASISALLEAAQGVGMTPRQSLLSVDVAAGAAGDDGGHPHRGGLGDRHRDIIDAHRPDQPRPITSSPGCRPRTGCSCCSAALPPRLLALAVDQLLALIEIGIRRRSRLSRGIGRHRPCQQLVVATLVPSLARSPSSLYCRRQNLCRTICAVGADCAAAAGSGADGEHPRGPLGSNVIFDALVSGDIDVYVDYSGTLWANQFHHSDIKPRQQLLDELKTTTGAAKSHPTRRTRLRERLRSW